MIDKPIVQPIERINNIFIQSNGLITFSSVRMACPSVRNFYSSVRTAKQLVRTANQTVQIIYSPVRTVYVSVQNFYSSVRTADQTVQIIYSSVRTIRQTVRTLQGPFVNRSSSVRFCCSNGFPLVSVLPFTVTNILAFLTNFEPFSLSNFFCCPIIQAQF